MKKSQISVTDLIMSVSIFIVLAAFIIYYWSATTSRLDNDINYEELQLKATRITDQLTKTPGDPSKWEVVWKNDLPHVYSLGLASSDRVLSDKKIFNLSVWADPVSNPGGYEEIKKILNLEGYDFNITVKIKDDILTLLRKFDIRIAYIQIGEKSCLDSLEQQLKSLFDCKPASSITDRKLERCEEYTTAASINNPDGAGTAFAANFNVFENLSEYDLTVIEDPRLNMDPLSTSSNEPTYAHSQKIINFTNNGGFILTTIRLALGNNYVMGMDFYDSGGNVITLTTTNDYYIARDSGDERFILFPGEVGSPATFTTNKKDRHVLPRANTSNPLFIHYPDTNPSFMTGARWDFGKGRSYYFSDCQDITISDEVGKASRRIIQGLASSLYSTLINSGKVPPKDANVVTVQRDVVFQNKSAVFEFSLWKQK